MPYKPKYCCQCGEKIDRTDWKPWTNRRFCELCETEFGIFDKLRWFLFGTALLFGLYGIGSYFQKPEKSLTLTSNQFAVSNTNGNANQIKITAQVPNNSGVQPANPANSNSTAKSPDELEAKLKSAEKKTIEPAEKVYFCGAPTKKGTLCSRRVKNGGRCWQHEGQAALLPQEKLLAAQ